MHTSAETLPSPGLPVITSTQAPSDGHDLRSAYTPSVEVLSKLSLRLRRSPFTMPSARPSTIIGMDLSW